MGCLEEPTAAVESSSQGAASVEAEAQPPELTSVKMCTVTNPR